MLVKTHSFDDIYPERSELGDEDWLERVGAAVSEKITRQIRSRPSRVNSIVALVDQYESQFLGLEKDLARPKN
jgi:hypothetical protein